MALKVYNSLAKKKEEFKPLKEKTVNMYTCGVTVYDKCHIGHARSLYVFDVMRKYLEYSGYQVNFIRNITDIDDKIINRAKELGRDWEDVVNENITYYESDLKKLGLYTDEKEPRATEKENIDAMIEHIKRLIEKEYAYEVDGDVYFSVRKFKDYGKLSGQSIEQMFEAVRVEKDEKKKDSLDFALWKKSKEDEPSWPSPWGLGRPGWHIECSVMSLKHLKCETLDIHGGGRDLIFPHHENEIAQAEALTTGRPFAKYWIHHGLLTINGQKMAKSLGNFVTIEDALKKYPVDDLKLFFLFSHYASPIDFTKKKMEEAHKALENFNLLLKHSGSVQGTLLTGAGILQKDASSINEEESSFIEESKNKFIDAMDDNFNTPKALGCLFDLVTKTNKFMEKDERDDPIYWKIVEKSVSTIERIGRDIFGLFSDLSEATLSEETQKILKEHAEARRKKDFKRSDELRNLLREKGLIVEDVKDGQRVRSI